MVFDSKYADDSTKSIGFSFIRAYNIWHRKIKKELLDIGLTHPQFVVLAALGYLESHQDEVKQIDVAASADMDVMTCSTIVRNLEKDDLLYRQNSIRDTRAKILSLTLAGKQVMTQALKIVESVDDSFFAALGDDQGTFNQSLHQLIQNAYE